MAYLYSAIAIIILYSFLSIVYWTLRNGISPMPSSPKATKAILQLIHENIPKDAPQNIVELGSGFLTLALPIAKQFPTSTITAYETSTIPYLISICLKYFYNISNLLIKRQNIFNANLNSSTLIICYLYPAAMEKLKPKFENELNLNTLIISNTFAIPQLKPHKTIILDDLYKTIIYLYKV